MAYSKITIDFVAVPQQGTILSFTETNLNISLLETFKKNRIGSQQVAIPVNSSTNYSMTIDSGTDLSNIDVEWTAPGGTTDRALLSTFNYLEDTINFTYTFQITSTTPVLLVDFITGAYLDWPYGEFTSTPAYSNFISTNYRSAFNLDYNSSSLFTVTSFNGSSNSGTGTVVIVANYANANFVLNNNTSGATVTIENQAVVPSFTISNLSFAPAGTDQSQKIKINATTSDLATKILSPFILNGNTANPFNFDWQRGQTITLLLENVSGIQVSQSIVLPAILNAANFDAQVNNSPNGATVVINDTSSFGLELQYSLDNINFQNSNVFNGLDVGSFTFYVIDQFGGLIVKSFTVDEFGIYKPYLYISKSNSIRFANRIMWGDAANYKNDENTLGGEVDVQLAYSGCQNFKSANVITTQFKSNYANNIVTVLKQDGTEVNIPVNKKSNNIGITDKRDAIKYNLGNGNTGLFFTAGNVYDYATNAITDQYVLNGLLPEWALVGNYVNIDNNWFLIEDIIYDDAKSADVIVIANVFSGIDTNVIVSSVYNDFNYEVHEFTIDMVNYLDQTIQVKIENTDSRFEPITHLSEKIDVAVNFDKNVEIYYWNDDNTDIFYATGIRHLINIELTKQEGVSQEESEAYQTDTTAILLSAQLYELDKFIFEPVSKEIWRKLLIALSHKNVFINGVQYVKSGNFETEGPLGESNLYVLNATMIKTGIVYNADGSESNDFNTGSIEIPGLIQTEIGFLKY